MKKQFHFNHASHLNLLTHLFSAYKTTVTLITYFFISLYIFFYFSYSLDLKIT